MWKTLIQTDSNLIIKSETIQWMDQLSKENKDYYGKLHLYIKCAGVFYDSKEVEQLLSQILQDILSAQRDGLCAEDYFGKNPQSSANELIQNLTKAPLKGILGLVTTMGGAMTIYLLGLLVAAPATINLLQFFLLLVLCCGIIGAMFAFFHKITYSKWETTKMGTFRMSAIAILFGLGVSFLAQSLLSVESELFTVQVPDFIAFVIIGISLISFTSLSFKKSVGSKIGVASLPFIWIVGLLGVANRIPQLSNWLEANEIFLVILLIVGYVLFFGLATYFLLKLKSKG